MEQGVYRIATLQSIGQMVDVSGKSTTDGASVILYQNNDQDNQRFLLQNVDGTYMLLRAVHSGKVLDVRGNKAANDTDVIQYYWHGGNNQQWRPTDASGYTINGQYYAAKILHSRMRDSLVLDANKEKFVNETKLIVYTDKGSANQQWVFIKDTRYDPSYAVPANIGLATSIYDWGSTVLSCRSTSATFYPFWQGGGNTWQVRWRWRGRRTGTNDWTGYTDWYSISNTSVPNGSNADEGWGNAWSYNVWSYNSDSTRHSSQGIAVNVDQGTYDKKEIQLEVRSFAQDNVILDGVPISTHGSSAISTISAVYQPTLSCSEISFSPTGLHVPITSDFRRDGNTVQINSINVGGKQLVGNYRVSNVPYTGGVVDIPMSQLAFIPEDGANASISVTYSTIDGTWNYSLGSSIAYNTNHGLSVNPVFTNGDGWTVKANISNVTESHCWLMTDNDGRTGFSECQKDQSGKFVIVPPLGKEYKLFFSAVSSSGWGTCVVNRPAINDCDYFLFNYEDEYAALPYNANVSWGLTRDINALQTQGRKFESVFFGDGSSRQITISGTLATESQVPRSANIDFEKLSVSNYAIVRYPTGERFDCAIEDVQFSCSNGNTRDLTIKCREVS